MIAGDTSATIVSDRPERISDMIQNGNRLLALAGYCHASTVAEVGLKKLLARDWADVANTEPMYLKDFVVRMPVRQEKLAT